jgi:hypothetical protein
MAEKIVLVCDVCGRPAAQSVRFQLGSQSFAQDLCSDHVKELVRNSHSPRRGRRPNVPPAPAASPKRSLRTRGRVTAPSSGKRPRAKGPRRRITDPVILEKRRAALEKARRVLAKKRAAAKRAG